MIRAVWVALALVVTDARSQGEAGLRQMWARYGNPAPTALLEAANAWQAYARQFPGDAFAPLALSLEATCALRNGETNRATRIWSAQTEPGETVWSKGVSRYARAWLTRCDRERVRESLQVFYRKKVRYPYSLQELRSLPSIAANPPPETDRWASAWRYQLAPLKGMKGLEDQSYTLTSSTLGESSDLRAVLARPPTPALSALRVLTTAVKGSEVVECGRAGLPGTLRLTHGQPSDAGFLCFFGDTLMIVCDDQAWHIVSRPGSP